MSQPWETILYPEREFGPLGDPSDWFDPAWMVAINQQTWRGHGMPEYSSQYLHGDIANMPFFFLALNNPEHFSANAEGDFEGPASVRILEKPASFVVKGGG